MLRSIVRMGGFLIDVGVGARAAALQAFRVEYRRTHLASISYDLICGWRCSWLERRRDAAAWSRSQRCSEGQVA